MARALQRHVQAIEHRARGEVAMRVVARGDAEAQAPLLVAREFDDGVGDALRALGLGDHAAALDHRRDLGALRGRGHHRPAAREHAPELGRHHEIGRAAQLRQQVHVGHVQEFVQSGQRLQVEEAHVRQVARRVLQRLAKLAVAADHEHDVAARREQARGVDDGGQSLLAIERAGEQADRLLVADGEHAPQARGAIARNHLVDVDPVGQQLAPLDAHALGIELPQHPARDRRHAIERAHQAPLAGANQLADEGAPEQAQFESGVHLEVLHVQPCGGAGQARGEPAGRRGEQRRRDDEHQRGPTRHQAHQYRKARRGEAREMQQARQAAEALRQPHRAAHHREARLSLLARVRLVGVPARQVPFRVVRRRAHHHDLVPAANELVGHLARVLADPRELGRKVHAKQDDFHARRARGRCLFLGGLAGGRRERPDANQCGRAK